MLTGRRVTVDLRESNPSLQNGKGRVDRAQGLIRSVKILGQRSSNGRIYLAETIRQAAHLYENKSVRLNHPRNPDDQRPVESVIGSLVNVRVGNDGDLYGDLRVVKAHPFASRLFEMAETQPHLVSLSHNAEGSCDSKEDTLVVYEITEVRSVDLVTDGATTSSLFESHQPKRTSKFDTPSRHPVSSRTRTHTPPLRARYMATTQKTLREHFERIPLLAKDRKGIKRLFEAGGPMAGMEDMPMDDAPPEDIPMDSGDDPVSANPIVDDPVDGSPDDALRGGFSKACHLIIDDTTIPAKDKLRRLKEIIMAGEKMISAGEEIPEGDDLETTAVDKPELKGDALDGDDDADDDNPILEGEDEDLTECDDEEMTKMRESKDPKLVAKANAIDAARYRNEKAVRELCESEGYSPEPIDFDAMCALRTDEKRLALIESRKAAQPRRPRTATPLPESRRTPTATPTPAADLSSIKDGDTESFAAWLCNGRAPAA